MKIRVVEPCGEKLSEMQATTCGHFCNSCSREVVDFRYFSDEEIVAFFQNPKNKNVCGSFLPSQLDRKIEVATFRKPYLRRLSNYFYGILVTSFLYLQSGCKKQETIPTPKVLYGYFSLYDGYPMEHKIDYAYKFKNKDIYKYGETNEFGEFQIDAKDCLSTDTVYIGYEGIIRKIFHGYSVYTEGHDTLQINEFSNTLKQIKCVPELGYYAILGMPFIEPYSKNPNNYLTSISWLERFFPPQVKSFFSHTNPQNGDAKH